MKSVIINGWSYLFFWSRVAPLLKRILGAKLHHKLGMYPRLGYWPQIRNPRSFNERILHRKFYTSDPILAIISDKYEVRNYVRERCGEGILVDLYHVTEDPSSIPYQELPNQFVVKPTHGSGWVKIVTDKESEDVGGLTDLCNQWLSQRFDPLKEEYWYEDITPRILVEELLPSNVGKVPRDYKFFVFNGNIEYIQVDTDRFSKITRRFYTPDWEPQDFTRRYPLGPIIEKPSNLDEMMSIAENLGQEFEFIRVDLYNTPKGIKFGELTPAPGSGGSRFDPIEYDFKLGECWEKNN